MTDRLSDIIKDQIKSKGSITFADFMEMALYWPGLGYYTSDRIPFGPGGDFYTSGHLSPVFGWMLAIQIEEMREILGDPDDFSIIEIGPGMGFIAEGVMQYGLENLKWRGNCRYILVEKNPFLIKEQKKRLSRFQEYLVWIDSIDELQINSAVVIANEVFDAVPVHLVQYRNGYYQEVYVGLHDNNLIEELCPLSSSEMKEYIKRYRLPSIEDYRTEVHIRSRGLLEGIFSSFQEGFLITIDYGWSSREYYNEERNKGTLLCYKGHTLNDNPLSSPGEQDITAHLNFSYLKDTAEEMGIKSIGFVPQGTFLVSLGIDRVLSEQLQRNPEFLREIQKIKGLILGMGETHKVLIQYKGKKDVTTLKGLSLRNRLYLL